MKIEADVKNISKLSDYYFLVPDYQREYIWKVDDQVEQFLMDLDNEYQPEQKDQNGYFLGSVIIVKNGEKHDVIDGQQRLTTIVITMCALRDLLKDRLDTLDKKGLEYLKTIEEWLSSYDINSEENLIRLDLQYEESRGFISRLIEGQTNTFAETASVKKMADAYDHIRDYLKYQLQDSLNGLISFARFFLTKVELVVIESENLSSALKIFETINQRGASLNAMDLVKNLIFSQIKEEQFSAIKTTWKSITNNLESCGESDNPLRFLRYFLMARYHHGILREDDIYKWIISAEGELSLQYKTRPMVLVKELEKLSERYANLVNATNEAAYWRENIRFPNVSNIGYINKYRSRQHLVLLMALDISCSDDVMDFLGAQLESFLFFTNTMAIQSKTYEQRFTQWAVKLRDVKTKAEVANVVSATLIPFVVERLDEFKERFSIINDYNFTPQYRQRYVLGRLENHIRHLCGFPEKSQQAIQQMQIEHILPQTVRNAPENGEFSDVNRTSYLYKLGNVTLLEGTINQSVNNCNDLSEDWFLKKQTEYLNSEIIMTRLLHSQYSIGDNTALNRFKLKYGYEYQDWSAESITSRQRLLMDLAIDCWRFNDQRIDAYIVNNLGTGPGNEFTL
ncbi:DUF262 domain-containing protein [Escherichia coli]|uniref:DUF262 domain-containing protein n=17 Tax=Escherichia coli TaxID=562 RepID=UPI001185B8AD|nr:DUF262 domain-containing protein [Escherichia coli]EFA4475678.1 DUF262 domain-containing protein [Escherichia coli]EFC4456636.1 DUF262 domain-containing protein [Escherichia coli]EFE5066722.1 DUF262 domain-containing protein [Escherichia coli]EFI5723532.1 DUF262 domain-containing protein [Escherichia coli]EHL7964888.1 DUF262 domain-containing protein [Escherichia coli]